MDANVKPAMKYTVAALAVLAAALGALLLVAGRAGQPASREREGARREAPGKKGMPDGAHGKPGTPDAGVFSRDELDAADALYKSAVRGDSDLVQKAREWAGGDVSRRIWVCDIARNAGRADALAVLAREALDACRGGNATYGRLFRTAKFLEECRDWKSAREALDLAAPLAKYRTYSEDVAFARLRVDLAEHGATDDRLAELRRISTSAAMNDNRLAAARLLKAYGQ